MTMTSMRTLRLPVTFSAFAILLLVLACAGGARTTGSSSAQFDTAQVPKWSAPDLDFFLHGSMGTEVVPEVVLAAFRRTYPDLFPGEGFAAFGAIDPLPASGAAALPAGFSLRQVEHLGGLPAIGLNCAACHTTAVEPKAGAETEYLIGTTGHFDAEAWFGAVTVAGLRTQDPKNMTAFLRNLLVAADPQGATAALPRLDAELQRQQQAMSQAIAADPTGSKGVAPGALHALKGEDLRLDAARIASGVDLAALAHSYLQLFHNMRAALHIPDVLPAEAPPASGPGRNDAFGLLAASLFQSPTGYAPVKYGVVWNAGHRPWVHWDGNTRSPIGRNLLASIGLGAPLLGKRAVLDLSQVQRHTALTEEIQPPRWPWAVDQQAAARGERHYQQLCASCHEGPETDAILYDPAVVGTDPARATYFDAAHAGQFNTFLGELQVEGYRAPAEAAIRSTGKYLAPRMAGVWARSPYLHNGSVRTLQELLQKPAERAVTFRRGSRVYDTQALGFADQGPYVLDTRKPGNGNGGHDYGTGLDAAAKRELIEYLKTR